MCANVVRCVSQSDLHLRGCRCVKYPEYPRTVTELVEYSSGGNGYRNQAGQGAANTGNTN